MASGINEREFANPDVAWQRKRTARPVKVIAAIAADAEGAGDAAAFLRAAHRIASRVSCALDVIIAAAEGSDALLHTAREAGAGSVLVASHASLARPVQSEQIVAVLLQALSHWREANAGSSLLVLLSAGALGDEAAARAATRSGAAALGRRADITVEGGRWIAHRTAYGGRLDLRIAASGAIAFASIRPDRTAAKGAGDLARASAGAAGVFARWPLEAGDQAAVGPAAGAGIAAGSSAVPVPAVAGVQLTGALPAPLPVEHSPLADRGPRLEAARLVVSGGRGMGGPEGFEQLGALARALGGALGGSLPTVDAGWVPVALQVGQSGKYVTPQVYVAVGISGTPQHLAGIAPDTRIVAINNDPDATAFNEAQIGVLADWRAIVPLLIEQATRRAGDERDPTA